MREKIVFVYQISLTITKNYSMFYHHVDSHKFTRQWMTIYYVTENNGKKCSEETQTLRTGCSKAEPKNFALPQTTFPGAKFNQPEMVTSHYLYLQTQFGEDRCTQFRVIVVTDPPTNRQDRLQYTAPQVARTILSNIVRKISK